MLSTPVTLTLDQGAATAVEPRVSGVVLWFDAAKGFGFIASDEPLARRVFVEYSGIDLPGYRTLTEHQPVTFTVERDERGLHASAVRPR